MVGLFLVNFFTVTPSSFSLAKRRFFSEPRRSSFVFSRLLIAASISFMASLNLSDANL